MVSNHRHRRRGFTLTELLVVIGIIVLLIGILLPILVAAQRNATKTRAAADLQTISMALEQYKTDFGDYPRPQTATDRGSTVLCRALLAPGTEAQDGAAGMGFRVRKPLSGPAQGKVYGPYLVPEKFKVRALGAEFQITDADGQPILYMLPRRGAPGTYDPGADADYFRISGETDNTRALERVRIIQGIRANPANPQWTFAASESPVFTAPFLLWTAGIDERFGPDKAAPTPPVTTSNFPELRKLDDIFNVPRE